MRQESYNKGDIVMVEASKRHIYTDPIPDNELEVLEDWVCNEDSYGPHVRVIKFPDKFCGDFRIDWRDIFMVRTSSRSRIRRLTL